MWPFSTTDVVKIPCHLTFSATFMKLRGKGLPPPSSAKGNKVRVHSLFGKKTATSNYQPEMYSGTETYMKMLEEISEIPFSVVTHSMNREGERCA